MTRFTLCEAGSVFAWPVRACAPEDVGSTHGYHAFLETIADSSHEERDRMLVWMGGAFDPEGFDINCVNRELRRRRL